VGQPEAHRVAGTLDVTFARPLRCRRAGGGVEDADIGVAVFGRDEPREVEARVLPMTGAGIGPPLVAAAAGQ
jgi:hypothetical protein